MPGLHELLEDAVGDPVAVDLAADLRRGRRALARRRTGWAVGATGFVVAVGVVGYTAIPHQQDSVTLQPADGGAGSDGPSDGPSKAPSDGPSSGTTTASPFYDVPTPPDGWHVVGERAQYVMLTRDGSGVTSVDTGFIGQIVIGLTDGKEHFESQPSVQHDGRTFYVNAAGEPGPGGEMGTLSVRSVDGNWLQLEFPRADFSVQDMVAYLDGVVVNHGALPAYG
jgi:hypothetical protein